MSDWIQSIGTLQFWLPPVVFAINGWLVMQLAMYLAIKNGQRWSALLLESSLQNSSIIEAIEGCMTPEWSQKKLDIIIDTIEKYFQAPERIKTLYRYGETALPSLVQQVFAGTLKRLESGGREKIEADLAQKTVWLFEHASLTYPQAEFTTDLLFNTLLTPAYIRQVLLEGLSETNIRRLEQNISEQLRGIQGFLLRLFGVRRGLQKIRQFLEEKPELAERQFTEFLDGFEVREKLAERISNFTFQDLPEDIQEATSQYVARNIASWAIENQLELSEMILAWSRETSRLITNRLLQWNLKEWLDTKHPTWRFRLSQLIHRQLKTLWQSESLSQFWVKQLTILITENGLSFQWRQNLKPISKALSLTGALLGFWLGLLSNLIQLVGWGLNF